MKTRVKLSLLLLRLSLGWLMFYSGVSKILNPEWSAEGYLKSAKTFSVFYQWLSQPEILPAINFLNKWGLTLLGISLIIGAVVRLSSILGIVLMFLYYFPTLQFPRAGTHYYLVDEHIIYALLLLLFVIVKGGRIWGLDKRLSKLTIFKKLS
jgi:thiosulfate dehydrogenase [quinone] large subunit